MSTTELIGAAEAARMMDMSRQGIIQAAAAGRVPSAGRIGKRRTYVFDRAAIKELTQSKGAK